MSFARRWASLLFVKFVAVIKVAPYSKLNACFQIAATPLVR